jgi:hypothetical protein
MAQPLDVMPAGSMDGVVPSVTFPNDVFEPAVLSLLKELNPREVMIEESAGESTSLAASLVRTESSIEAIVSEMEQHGESPTLFKRLRQKEAEQQEITVKLAEARLREQNPKSAAYSEMVTLMDIATSEPHRLRLRELLRTVISEVWVLVVPRRSIRLCAVQIFFSGNSQSRRDYLIVYKSAAGGGRKGFWKARSLKHDLPVGTLDLRNNREHVDALARTLESVDLDLLTAAMD